MAYNLKNRSFVKEIDFSPAELPYLAVAERLGLGTTDWQSVTTKV